jgi:hypothetical protein
VAQIGYIPSVDLELHRESITTSAVSTRGGTMKGSTMAMVSASALALALIGTVSANDSDDKSRRNRVVAVLKPSAEVPLVSSPAARGLFKATIDEANQVISYELSYEGLEGVPGQAHIHIGQPFVGNGGVSVFLCGNPPTVPAATVPQPPACPPSPATITGEIRPANIIGPASQGVAATTATTNEFAELVELLLSGDTYANVHSSKFPTGEVRGQVVSLPGRRNGHY